MALGLFLVVGCATGAVVVSAQMDDREPVLALAGPVTIGQVLTPGDLREVSAAVDAGVPVLDVSQADSVVGTTMAVSAPAGALLSQGMLGDTAPPGPREAIVAMALPPGAAPPETSPGTRVVVIPVAADSGDTPKDATEPRWAGVVVGVHPAATGMDTVVSVQTNQDDARAIAAAPAVRLVISSPGRR